MLSSEESLLVPSNKPTVVFSLLCYFLLLFHIYYVPLTCVCVFLIFVSVCFNKDMERLFSKERS